MERLIGDLGASTRGPTLLCVGGLHGSEPAGVRAAERFVEAVRPYEAAMNGRVVAIRGNLEGLRRGIRYVDRDLNRMWDEGTVTALSNGVLAAEAGVEFDELRAVHELLHRTISEARSPICVLDFHTTSSESIPFVWLVPSTGARDLLAAYGLPIVYHGRGEELGALGYYAASLGHKVVIAEGGQHDSPEAADHLEAILWITCVELGILASRQPADDDEYQRSIDLLKRQVDDEPLLYEVVEHHHVTDGDGFEMLPGYRSFQPVVAGEELAQDNSGPIRADGPGRILMPLYRPPCSDGFMIVEERRRWPSTSAR